MRFFIILIGLVVGVQQACFTKLEAGSCHLFSRTVNRKLFDKINEHLVNNVESYDIELNIAEAKKWLEELSKSRASMFNGPLIRALKQFIELDQTIGNCDKNSLAILKKNILSAKALAKWKRFNEVPSRRIDNIIYSFANKHAIDCQDSYMILYNAKKDLLDKEQVERVHRTFGRMLDARTIMLRVYDDHNRPLNTEEIFGVMVENMRPIENAVQLQRALYHMVVTRDDPDKKYVGKTKNELDGTNSVDKVKFEGLFNKYLVKPCEYYTRELGEIFEPARDDAKWGLTERSKGEAAEFYRAWSYYRLCQRLTTVDKSNMLKQMLKIAANWSI